MSSDTRGKAIAAYLRCNSAMTDAEFASAWDSMPDEARHHFPEQQWPEFFAFKCPQDLHGWYTSSVAESENKSLLDVRSLDPFNALLAIVQQCTDRLAKQQTLAIDDAAKLSAVLPGVPPAVVLLLWCLPAPRRWMATSSSFTSVD